MIGLIWDLSVFNILLDDVFVDWRVELGVNRTYFRDSILSFYLIIIFPLNDISPRPCEVMGFLKLGDF